MVLLFAAACLAGGLLCLLTTLFLLFTVYIYYIHSKYSHIPSPKRSRYIVHGLYIFNTIRYAVEPLESSCKIIGKNIQESCFARLAEILILQKFKWNGTLLCKSCGIMHDKFLAALCLAALYLASFLALNPALLLQEL